MGAIKELKVKISADANGLKGALNGISDDISKVSKDFEGLNKLGEGFKSVGQKMTLVGAGIVASIGGIVAKGAEWSAQVEGQKFLYNNLDKSIQKTIDANSKNANAIGLTAQQYKNGATTMSTYYKNMGMSTEETAKLSGETMNLVADLGAVVDMPFDEAMSRFKSGLMGNYEALDAFGINLSANTLQNSEYVKSLNKKWNQLSDNEKMMAAYNEILRQSAPMTGLASQEAESFGMKFKLLKEQISETVGQIGTSLLPVLEPLVQKFSEVATKISEWVQEHPKLTQAILMVVGIIGTLMVVLGPILILIGTIITSFVTLSAISTVLGISIGAIVAPVALVIAAIVALIAIGVALWQNWDLIKEKANEVWKKVCDAWKNMCDWISKACNNIGDWVSKTWDNICNWTSKTWNNVKTAISTVWNSIKSFISDKLNQIKTNITNIWNNIKSVTSTVWNSIKSFVSSLWNSITSVASSVFNSIKTVISTIWNTIKSTTTSVWNGIQSVISSVSNAIKSVVLSAWNGIQSVTSSVLNGVKSVVSNVFNGIKSSISSVMSSIRSSVSSAWSAIKGIFSSVLKPNIKMPKISISGKFSLNPPSVPKFGISWYSKGAIFKRPTVLGGMGVGDAHNGIGSNAEAILPINQLPKLLGLDKMQNGGVNLSIENFNNNTDKDIEYLANELAFYMNRKRIGVGGAY